MRIHLAVIAAAVSASSAFSQNLLQNGSFETESQHTQLYGTLYLSSEGAPPSWGFTASDKTSLSLVNRNPSSATYTDSLTGHNIGASNGQFYVQFQAYDGNNNPSSIADYDTLYQSFSTTLGQTYNVSYDLYLQGNAGYPPSTGDFFQASINGVHLAGTTMTGSKTYVGHWETITSSFVANSTTSVIGFSAFNDVNSICMDNVSVTAQAAPEPLGIIIIGGLTVGFIGIVRKRS